MPNPPSAGRPILEAHYREHLECDELCRSAWARMVGRVPSEAVLAYMENRPGCRLPDHGPNLGIREALMFSLEDSYATDPTPIAADAIPVMGRHHFGPPWRR